MSEDDTHIKITFWPIAVAFAIGVATGAVMFSTQETNTVYETEWKTPDDQTTKYTIQDVHATVFELDENSDLVGFADYEEDVRFYDETLRLRGGEVLIANGIKDLPFKQEDAELSIGSIDYKVEIYQGGNVIDSYETSCYPSVEDISSDEVRYMGDLEPEIYSQCFDVEVES